MFENSDLALSGFLQDYRGFIIGYILFVIFASIMNLKWEKDYLKGDTTSVPSLIWRIFDRRYVLKGNSFGDRRVNKPLESYRTLLLTAPYLVNNLLITPVFIALFSGIVLSDFSSLHIVYKVTIVILMGATVVSWLYNLCQVIIPAVFSKDSARSLKSKRQ